MDHEENLTPYEPVDLRATLTKRALGKALKGAYPIESAAAMPDHLTTLIGQLQAQESAATTREHPPPKD